MFPVGFGQRLCAEMWVLYTYIYKPHIIRGKPITMKRAGQMQSAGCYLKIPDGKTQ